MLVDPDGFLIVVVICGALGFLIGWMGGVAEGRERERARRATNGVASAQRQHPRDEIVDKCDAMLRDDVEVPSGCTCSEGGSGWCAACDGSPGNAGVPAALKTADETRNEGAK